MFTTIVGKKRRGKTSLAKEIIRNGEYDQVYILDFAREYQFLTNKRGFYVSSDSYHLWLFCEKVWETSDPNKKNLVVFDEIHRYGKYSRPIHDLYRYAAKCNIDIIAISHRPTDFHPDWREQFDEFKIFRLTDRTTKRFLRDYLPDHEIEKIANLDVLKYVTLEL